MHVPDFHGLSDVGRLRTVNEDQLLIAELSRSLLLHQTTLPKEDSPRLSSGAHGFLFLVADGLGSRPAGDRASALAVNAVLRYVLDVMPWFFRLRGADHDLREELARALSSCQSTLEMDVAENPSHRGMGTTLTLAYLLWPQAYVVHVGNSRCYLWRDARLDQITYDNSVLPPRGPDEAGLPALAAEWEAPVSPFLRAAEGGAAPEPRPAFYKVGLRAGDTLLLSTDGLTRQVSEAEIAEVLRRPVPARDACIQLIDRANDNGGRDNTTVIVVRFPRGTSPTAAVLSEEAALPRRL